MCATKYVRFYHLTLMHIHRATTCPFLRGHASMCVAANGPTSVAHSNVNVATGGGINAPLLAPSLFFAFQLCFESSNLSGDRARYFSKNISATVRLHFHFYILPSPLLFCRSISLRCAGFREPCSPIWSHVIPAADANFFFTVTTIFIRSEDGGGSLVTRARP